MHTIKQWNLTLRSSRVKAMTSISSNDNLYINGNKLAMIMSSGATRWEGINTEGGVAPPERTAIRLHNHGYSQAHIVLYLHIYFTAWDKSPWADFAWKKVLLWGTDIYERTNSIITQNTNPDWEVYTTYSGTILWYQVKQHENLKHMYYIKMKMKGQKSQKSWSAKGEAIDLIISQ